MNGRSELEADSDHMLTPRFINRWYGQAEGEQDPVLLLVAADREILTLTRQVAAHRGLSCDTVMSLGEARRLMASTDYDIVFLDTTLQDEPDADALGARRSLASHSLAIAGPDGLGEGRALELLRDGARDQFFALITPGTIVQRLDWVVGEWRARGRGSCRCVELEETLRSRTQKLLRAMKEIDRVYEASVEVIGSTLDMCLPETAEHVRRVAESSGLIGDVLGLPAMELRDLRWGARLHDIGKIAVPAPILAKQGTLTEDELLIVRAHTIYGSEMLSDIEFLSRAREAVLSHHERYDGSGYPYGLHGEEIPLSARIVAVADAFDAMSHDRPYRRALSPRAVTEQLEREAGSHYDPRVVESFLHCQDKAWCAQALEIDHRSAEHPS